MAVKNQSITVKVRYEYQRGGTEHFPCYYECYKLTEDEAATMIEADLRIRREASDDPDSVQPRSIELIFQEEIGKPEYNHAHRFYRHASDSGVDTSDGPAPDKESGKPRGKYVRPTAGTMTKAKAKSKAKGRSEGQGTRKAKEPDTVPFVDPTSEWDQHIAIKDALAKLEPRERKVLFDLYMQGFTQRQLASELGITQPRVAVIAKKAKERLAMILGMGVIK